MHASLSRPPEVRGLFSRLDTGARARAHVVMSWPRELDSGAFSAQSAGSAGARARR